MDNFFVHVYQVRFITVSAVAQRYIVASSPENQDISSEGVQMQYSHCM